MENVQKKTWSYFCRPCGHKHACPTNAKCTRKRPDKSRHDMDGSTGQAESSTSKRQKPRGSRPVAEGPTCNVPESPVYRSIKRNHQASSETVASDDESPSKSGQSESSLKNINNDNQFMNNILDRLEAISNEGKAERERVAEQSKADRDYFKSAISALQANVLSDDEEAEVTTGGVAARALPSSGSSGRGQLPMGRDALHKLRSNGPAAKAASDVLQRHCFQMEEPTKRLKSGYNLTINGSATVVAQWPQMNVFRAPNDTATYDTLTINEFCNGYLLYVRDCLNAPQPDILTALDYIDYN